MKAEEIRDRESLEPWLEGQPREVAVWIAFRAAARVVPIWWEDFRRNSSHEERDLHALSIWHCLLASASFANAEDADFRVRLATSGNAAFANATTANPVATNTAATVAAANAAASTVATATAALAYATIANAAAAVRAVATTADAAAANAAGIWETICIDAGAVEAGWPPDPSTLWPGDTPLEAPWIDLRTHIQSSDDAEHWAFWVAWYDSLLTARPMLASHEADHEMLTQIALSDEIDWDDPQAANSAIREIWEGFKGKGATSLSEAYPVDFSFDALAKVMRMVGIEDDTAHLRNPAIVQSFLDDCDELKDTLQNFSDFAKAGAGGSNRSGMLHHAAELVLQEFARTRDDQHLRARHVVRLAHQLEAFSKEEGAREELGDTLANMLDDAIGLLRTITRKHFGPSYTALAPLAHLSLDHIDQDAVIDLFDRMIARLETLPTNELMPLDEDGLAVFRDMIRELHEYRAAIAEASSEEFRQLLESRFAESIGGSGLAFGRFVETSVDAAGSAGSAADQAAKQYRRVKTVDDIVQFVERFLSGGGAG